MTNADKFKNIFGLYATELWSMPEKDFLKWLNSEAMNCSEFPDNWISCSKRLPVKNGRYWVWADKFVVPDHTDEPATYEGSTEANFLDGRWWGNIGKVYAWMPLPKPYKGVKE